MHDESRIDKLGLRAGELEAKLAAIHKEITVDLTPTQIADISRRLRNVGRRIKRFQVAVEREVRLTN